MFHRWQRFLPSVLCTFLLFFLVWGTAHSQEKTNKYVLENGLKVLIREDHSVPIASLVIAYQVGSRNERLGTTGISHLLEHMLFRGTEKYPPGKISKVLDVMGADYNAFTTYDITAYYETVPVRYLETAMDIEADRMVNSRIDSSILEQEKTVVLSELEGDENSPLELLWNDVQAAHFVAHPYHWPVGGFKNDVAGLTREDIVSYYKSYYCPNNAVLTIFGDIEPAQTLEMVKKYFGSLPRMGAVPKMRSVEPQQKSEKRVVLREKGSVSYIQVAYHTPSIKEKDLYALSVMDSILSAGASSRLYKALVETGLATSVSASMWENIDPGMYSILITLAPGKEHARVEAALFEELEKFKKAPITTWELEKAANLVKASFFKSRDSISLLAEYLSWYESIYTCEYLDTYLSNIKKVTEGDVRAAAVTYLTESNRTVGWFCAVKEGGALKVSDQVAHRVAPGTYDRHCGDRLYYRPRGDVVKPLAGESRKSLPVAGSELSFTRETLPNGLVLIMKENHANPTVTISGYVRSGAMYDPPGKEGLSYFTASMLDRGTEKKTFQQIAEALDFIGAGISFSGSRECVEIGGWALAEHLESTLEILSDSLINPAFPGDQKALIHEDIVSQLREQSDDPGTRALITLRSMVFPEGHPYHSNIKGYESTVGKIDTADLKDFHKKYYRPDTTVLVFAGDFDSNALRKLVDTCFGSWKKPADPVPEMVIPPVQLPARKQSKVITMKDKRQVEIAMGNRSISRDSKDYYAFNLLNYILGGNTLTSRLGTELREKEGLVYGIWCSFLPTKGEALWCIMYGTNEKNVPQSLASVQEVVKGIQTKPVTDQELEDARNTLINSLAVSLETNEKVAGLLIDIEYFNLGKNYLQELPVIYSQITKEDLLRVAQKYIHMDKTTQVITGPHKE